MYFTAYFHFREENCGSIEQKVQLSQRALEMENLPIKLKIC